MGYPVKIPPIHAAFTYDRYSANLSGLKRMGYQYERNLPSAILVHSSNMVAQGGPKSVGYLGKIPHR